MRFVVAFLVAAACAPGWAAQEEPKGARGAGYTFAKAIVKPALKNPSSADFDWQSVKVTGTAKMKPKEDGSPREVVTVTGVVRATNSFNAVVPSNWLVIMLHDAEEWKPIVVMHENDFLLKTEEGERFLKLLDERREKKKAEAAAKNEEVAAQQKHEKHLQSCYAEGHKQGEETASRFGRNVKTAPDSLVEKQAKKALKTAGYSAEDETDRFMEGFRDAIEEAKKK